MYTVKEIGPITRFVIENEAGLQWKEDKQTWATEGTLYWDEKLAQKQAEILSLVDQVAALKDAVETRDEELQAAISERDGARHCARVLAQALQEFAESAQQVGLACAIPVVLGPRWLTEENT